MKKILQIGMSSSLGGIEVFLKNLYDNINREKFQIDFIDTTEKGICYKEYFEQHNSKVYKIVPRRENFYKNKKQLEEIIKNGGYDVVHFHLNTLSYISPILLANKYNIKMIVHSHNEWKGKNIKVSLLHKINKRKIENMNIDRLACSEVAGKWIFGNKPFMVINNGIDTKKFKFSMLQREKIREELKIPNNYTVIGNVAAFREQKNHKFLIDIFYDYLKINPQSILLLVGEGKLKKDIQEKVKKLGIENNVKFLGIRDDVNLLMNAFDIFVFPSLYEGFGIALLEAQCNGILCFASDTIPKSVKVSENLKFLSLKEDSNYWAEYIWENSKHKQTKKREDVEMEDMDYSVKTLTKKIEEIYDT